jgi:hypothetical protein
MYKEKIFFSVFLFVTILSCNKMNAQVRFLDTEILPHPRILFTAEEEKATKARFGSIPLLDSLHSKLLECAEQLLNNPVQDYAQFGLEASREQI